MSPKLKKWLLIGGGTVVGLILVCLITFLVLGPGALRGGMATEMPAAMNAITREESAKQGFAPSNMAMPPAAPEMDSAYGMGGGPGDDGSGFAGEMDNMAMPTPAPAAVANSQAQNIERLIIRNGTVSISAENTYNAEKTIEAMVAQMAGDGAFVVSTTESPTGYDESPYINMVIRIPAARFDEVMDSIAKLAAPGTTPTLTKTGEDVTDQYVDVKARVESLEAARDRLKEIMSEAQNTNDLLMAEQQLSQREAEIEALKGRMQYLEQSAALSSITITLQPYVLSQPVDTSWRPLETVREAFDSLVRSLRNFGDFLITFVILVVPWLLVAGLVIYGIYRFVRSRVMRARARNAASGTDEV